MVKDRYSVRKSSKGITRSLGKAKKKIVSGKQNLKTATRQILNPTTVASSRIGVTGNSIKDLANMGKRGEATKGSKY
jgi:hypothetical protein